MKAVYIFIISISFTLNAMDSSSSDSTEDMSHPTIVLDVDLISDEMPTEDTYSSGLSGARKMCRSFSLPILTKLGWKKKQIITTGQELAKTIHGATSVTKQTFENLGFEFNEEQIKLLTSLGVKPRPKEEGIQLAQTLHKKGFSLILATHHDLHHYREYIKHMESEHKIVIPDIFKGAVVIKGPYKNDYDTSNIPYFISHKARPSAEYSKGIHYLNNNAPAILFDTDKSAADKHDESSNITAHHVSTAAQVEEILRMLGYLQ